MALVGLLDTLHRGHRWPHLLCPASVAARDVKLDLNLDGVRGLASEGRAEVLLKHTVEAGTVPADFDAYRLRRMVDMYQYNLDALTTYTAGAFNGKVMFFRVHGPLDVTRRAASRSRPEQPRPGPGA